MTAKATISQLRTANVAADKGLMQSMPSWQLNLEERETLALA